MQVAAQERAERELQREERRHELRVASAEEKARAAEQSARGSRHPCCGAVSRISFQLRFTFC